MGFLALLWHKLAQLALWRRAACILSVGFLAGCLGGPHPLPPVELDDGRGPSAEGPGKGGPDVSAAAGSVANPPASSAGTSGTPTNGAAGRGAQDAGIDDCDAGATESGDASTALCEDDASVVAP